MKGEHRAYVTSCTRDDRERRERDICQIIMLADTKYEYEKHALVLR